MAEYLAFHYLEPSALLPKGVVVPKGVKNFPTTCVRHLISEVRNQPNRALDLGCAVGRATFEIARHVPEVVGIDYSQSFIRAAKRLQRSGRHSFRLLEEGKITSPHTARIPSAISRKRIRFLTGDVLHLPRDLGPFDLVLAANLIDRLSDPQKFLTKVLPKLVKPGGIVLLTSPYTWSPDFTPKRNWLRNSFSSIHKLLRPKFRLLHRQDLPFLLREHRRKFQFTFADATLWARER